MPASNDNESLVFDGRLPVSFTVIDAIPGDSTLAIINEKNEHTLRSSLIPADTVDLDEHDELGQYLKRQEVKLDLLLDLVTELLTQQNRIPDERQLRLTAQGVAWSDPERGFDAGACIEVNIYLTPSVPRALRFFGELRQGASGNNVLAFVGVNQQVTDLMEKILFRHHRRSVAQQRLER